MDTMSYLLGKNYSGGGGGGSDLDWNVIGYSGTPQSIIDGYNLAVKIKDEWTPNSRFIDYPNVLIAPYVDTSNKTGFNYFADSCKRLIQIPLLDTSNVTNMAHAFSNCSNLTTIPQFDTSKVIYMSNMFSNCTNLTTVLQFDTSNVTSMNDMFSNCSNLTTVPQFNTSKVDNMDRMFHGCSALTTVPQFDTSKVTNIYNMFGNCTKLSDESLNNILAMCINMTSYTGTKTLKQLGIANTTIYPVARIQALSNYQAFIDAGWTIGY